MVARDCTYGIRFVRLGLALLFVLLAAHPMGVRAGNAPSPGKPVGEIRRIIRGLGVTPPRVREFPGHVQELTYNAYGLQTRQQQLASMGFVDATVLYINQNTSLVLRSPSVTEVKSGEVGQTLQPGTNHRVQTAAAVASAVGTDFDVQVTRKGSTFYVREGSLLVSNALGSVYVTTGEAVVTRIGKAPQAPFRYTPAQYAKAFLWRKLLTDPIAPQDTNVALEANGGGVFAVSSELNPGDGQLAIDGRLDRGWTTAAGQVGDQSLTLALPNLVSHVLSGVVVSNQPFGDNSAAGSVKDFAVAVSTAGTADADFHTVFSGTALQVDGLQRFTFTRPVTAKYVRFTAIDNYGDPQRLFVTELEVVGRSKALKIPSVVPCYLATPCIQGLLTMVNQARRQAGAPPLQLSEVLSTGTGTCVGAFGHSLAMAESGQLWHTNGSYPQASFPTDVCVRDVGGSEDVGKGVSGNEVSDVHTIIGEFLHEPHDAKTCHALVNHACILMNPVFAHIGIGLYYASGDTWITLTFVHH